MLQLSHRFSPAVSGIVHQQEIEMNSNKARDPRFWRKWHSSGAVTKRLFPEGSLVIDAIATHFVGKAAGHQTLTLGKLLVSSGQGWKSYRSLYAVVVPTDEMKHRIGVILSRIPGNAVPVDVFFPRS
jgi:hypothetical protein